MVTIPVNLTGGSYKHKSLPLSAQRTINFWPQKQGDQKAQSENVLTTFPGLRLFATNASGTGRGMFEHKGALYKVTGNKLFTVNSAGTHTEIGAILGGTRCVIDALGDSVIIVNEGYVYEYDGATLTAATDIDFESPRSVTVINNQAVYDGDSGRFCVSDPAEPLTINALNYATAESNADNLIRVMNIKQIVLLFGDKSIEPQWNDGDGNPPFSRVESGIMDIGLGAFYSLARNDNVAYFLGDDRQVYVLQGYNANPISTDVMAREFQTYSRTDDAEGFCFSFAGKNFYVISFPSEDRTWCYQEGGEFFELSSDGRWSGGSYAFAFGKHLIEDYSNGNIYELSDTVYTDNSQTIIRTRDSAPLHAGLLEPTSHGKKVTINRFELILETGIGLLSGQGSDPTVMLSWSNDARTFSTEIFLSAGALGNFRYKLEAFSLGSAENWIFRIRTSDPVPFTIYSAAADVEIGI